MIALDEPSHVAFWRYVWAVRGSVTLSVLPRVAAFGAFSVLVVALELVFPHLGLAVGPVEVAGGALVLLLVLRSNAGYERWWEGRKLWGGIVNQSRNLAIGALAYGPRDAAWRRAFVRWAASFPHVARRSLRAERDLPEVEALVGPEAAAVAAAQHMPMFVAQRLASLLRVALDDHQMNALAFAQLDKERALLIDHVGACERILTTPLPLAYVIKIRRFVALYLVLLPFALVDKVGWTTPLLTMLIAYPVLGVDQIGAELENPFSLSNISHLPLDEISTKIEKNLLAALESSGGGEAPARTEPRLESPSRSPDRASMS